ncbi:MAG TPA: glucosidase [Verrucomicrobiae bacterium]|nr:glucosidase [Verrucomicrobiae bacterium]
MNAESQRLEQARDPKTPWKKWGPYLSERQWGTVREDYSDNGDAWNYFPHDHARSRAYRWGEDGLAGISDDKQRLCFALALWNGKDPILKERLFGLTNSEGNHGEDVKECYFYLDNTPTHAYMKYLYKYPQAAYPYADLVETNRRRTLHELEYELLDTGVFSEDRYFDVFVEYAKEAPEDILIKITVCNRGPAAAELHVLPTLWFRNTWASWTVNPSEKPVLKRIEGPPGTAAIAATHPTFGVYYLYCDGDVPLLFTENETNNARLFPQFPNAGPWVKDGINNYLVHGQLGAVNPDQAGTKASADYRREVGPCQSITIRLRLTKQAPMRQGARPRGDAFPFGTAFDETFTARLREADAFYASITPPSVSEDEARVMRQALAGMLWSKQYYYFNLGDWLSEHHAHPLRGGGRRIRNRGWFHMLNDSVISMPDKWEYPWYAAWDLAIHTVVLNMVDRDFAREQLDLMLSENYLHPNGQIPAYEWNFGDVNPPVHAFAILFNYVQQKQLGSADVDSLKETFQKLLLNFTWWVNQKDREGNNVFEGGFLGMDNIGIFDRSAPLPSGGTLEQADGSAWMCLFCQNMLEIALELAKHDPGYQDIAAKFAEHFFWIAAAMDRVGINEDELWDEEDGFFYDLLRLPDGTVQRLKTRSMVGLLPLCATAVIPADTIERFPKFTERLVDFLNRHHIIMANIHPPNVPGAEGRYLLSICDETKLRRILTRMLDEERFLSPFGIRSLSKWHEQHPYVFELQGQRHEVKYLPGESESGMFGGNSNWRGPIWLPVNMLILRGLQQFYLYYGDTFKIESPTGSGRMMNLFEVTKEISRRLTRIFLRDENGRRPVFGGSEKFQTDPHWRDYIQFYEYFHGDNGAGLGASHQTGWTGLIARLIHLFATADADRALEPGKIAGIIEKIKETEPSPSKRTDGAAQVRQR